MFMPPISDDKVGATNADYRLRNAALFNERSEVLDQLAELVGIDADLRPSAVLRAVRGVELTDPVQRREARRLLARVEDITSRIVVFNYGLVRDYIERFSKINRDAVEDYEGAGMVGLMRAVDTYDPALGSFGQWAMRPIKREVLRAVRDNDHQNLSPGDFERRPEILAARDELLAGLEDEDGPQPTFAEIAARAQVTVDQVARVLAPPRLDSLALPVAADGEATLGDTIEDREASVEAQVMAGMSRDALERYGLSVLTAREMTVIARRFGLDGEPESKLSAIGSALHLSREAVRNIEAKALSKLGHPSVVREMLREGRD